MSIEPNGVYLAYFSAEFGTTVGIFLIKDGAMSGGDLGAGIYDGHYEVQGKVAKGKIRFQTRGAGTSITGATSDVPMNYETPVVFSLPLEEADYHEVDSPAGRVNVRFHKIREI